MNPLLLLQVRLTHRTSVLRSFFLIIAVLVLQFFASAEGTKELLPVSSSSDTLIKKAILSVGGTGSGTCGAYGGGESQRINIEIADASTEVILLGFNVVSGGPGYFRVFDPAGVPITSATQIPSSGRGFIPFFQNAINGPDTLNAGGYNAIAISPSPGVTGKYFIEFNSTGPALTPATAKVGLKIFDISVADISNAELKTGRVSSASWSINAGNIADYNTTFEGNVFVLSPEGFVVKADFKGSGFAPASFRLNFNSYGTQNTGNIYSDRRSRTGDFMSPQFPVYLNNPDSLLHPSAITGTLNSSSINFYRCKQNEFTFELDVTAKGIVEIIYDSNNNGLFDNATADKRFSQVVTSGHNSITWNGLDGSGNLVAVNSQANFVLQYTQSCINFPVYDAEVDSGGVVFTNVRPLSASSSASLQYYDDTLLLSNLSAPFNSNKLPTTGPQYVYQQFNGCNSPCHKWEAYNGNNSVADFGNLSTVNTYVFASEESFLLTRNIPDFYLADAGVLQTVCKTDTLNLQGTISSSLGNAYTGSFQWKGSGIFIPNDSSLTVQYIPSSSELSGNFFRLYLQLRGNCSVIQDSVKINLDTPPTTSNAGSDQVVCQNLAALNGNSPSVGIGTWSILNGAGGSLINLNAANSTVLNLSNAITKLRWKISNGVCSSSSDTVAIQFTPVIVEIIGMDTNYCTTAPLVVLSDSHLNATPSGGNFSFYIDGNLAPNLEAANLALGSHVLSLAYTEPIAGTCIAYDTLTFTVGGSCNKAPVANDDFFILDEDMLLNGQSVIGNDSDPNLLDILTVQTNPVVQAQHGLVILQANGTFNYAPNLNFFGSDFFSYRLCDSSNVCDTATVHLQINSVNDAPFALNDSYSTNEDNSVNGFILGNDFDVENDSIYLDTLPALLPQHGALVLHTNGSFDYAPDVNFNGSDFFTYRVCDSGSPIQCNIAQVLLTVNPVNDPPQANFGRKTVFEDMPNALNVLSNDFDVDGNMDPSSLSLTLNGNPNHGTAVVDAGTNKIIYSPSPNYYGNDTLIYEICDTGFPLYCDTSITYITVLPVNDKPIAHADFSTVSEDSILHGNSVLLNDSDLDGDTLTVSTILLNDPFNGIAQMTNSGTYTYTPNTNYHGNDYFVYNVCDNGVPQLCGQDTVFIAVTSVNDAPIAKDNKVVTSLNTSITASVLTNDFDADTNIDASTLSIATPPFHGTAQVNANGTITYLPQNGYVGLDSLLYSVCDSGLPVLCASAKLIFEVGYVNLPPVCNDDIVITNEDISVSIDILANDSDPNNNIDASTLLLLQNAQHGTTSIDFINGKINYTPQPNYFGRDTLVYLVCDVGTFSNCDTGSVFISINSINDSPTAGNDTLITDEDFAILGNLLTNDFDTDAGDVLQLSLLPVIAPQHGVLILSSNGAYNYSPASNYFGSDFFSYEVCDNGIPNNCSTANVKITINPVNDAPIALKNVVIIPINFTASVAVLNNDFDVDGNLNPNSLAISALPANGIALIDSAAHTIVYTPSPNYFGLDTIQYTVCDSANPVLCAQAILVFNVGGTNNAPSALPDFAATAQNTAVSIAVLVNDFDVDGNINKASVDVLVNSSHGNISLDNSTGIITYEPNPGFAGKDTLIYEICDGGLPVYCDTALVIITVNGNLAPTANPDFNTTNEDTPVNGNSVLLNDSDPENGVLSIAISALFPPSNGTVNLNSNGTYTYFPNLNFYGTDSFKYELCDNGQPVLCDTAIVLITVNAVNDAPLALNDTIQMPQGQSFSGNLISNDFDVDSPTLLANQITLNGPSHGTIFLANSGVYTYTPLANYSGLDSFQYIICDNGTPNLCDTALVFISIGSNNAPLALDDNFATNEDTPILNASVISNDSDPDGAILLLDTVPVLSPIHGILTLNPNGTFYYAPDLNFNGTDIFSYAICDGGTPNLCDTALVTISVNAVNDAPLAQNDYFVVLSNAALNGNVSNNDNDVDGSALTLNTTPVIAASSGTVVLNTNGQFSYIPNTNFTGSDSFSYEICDGGSPALCDTAQVFIQIQNRQPLTLADTFIISSNVILNANCMANDSDPESGVLTMSTLPVVNVTNGALSLNSSGDFTYIPNTGFTGTDFFYYTICDNALNSLCNNAKVSILVLNTAPIAVDDTVYVQNGASVSGNLITNDIDAEAGNLIASIAIQAQHGTVLIKSNGDFVYTAGNDFIGSDYFTYEICDNGTPSYCDSALVVIKVSDSDSELNIPNAFSPNGDNVNDVLEISGIATFPECKLDVFDRNGLLVFSSIGYQSKWSGKDNKEVDLPNGSYFYVFDKKDGTEALTGYIVISR